MATSEKLKMVLRSAMDDWDIHIEACADCLIQGMQLCIEGQIIMARADALREKLNAVEPKLVLAESIGSAPEGFQLYAIRPTARAR